MITILSYCDTNEKKNQLSNLITSLKIKFPEKKILVYVVGYITFAMLLKVSISICNCWFVNTPTISRFALN